MPRLTLAHRAQRDGPEPRRVDAVEGERLRVGRGVVEEVEAKGVDEVHRVGRREGEREVVAAVALHQCEVVGELARA